MIKVLIVEDSRVVSEYLNFIFINDPLIDVVGNVSNGKMAVEFIKNNKVDVITMDIDMPIMDGLEATRIIMSTTPIPILIVTSSRNANDIHTSIEALAAGALAVIEKPAGIGHPKEEELAKKLTNMVKVMAEVNVITRKPKIKEAPAPPPVSVRQKVLIEDLILPDVIAVGVSSGGPQALQIVFSKITSRFPAPIVVVQHITDGFLDSLVNWIGNTINCHVHIAKNDEFMLPGHIYFAPNGFQMGVQKSLRAKLTESDGKHSFIPSAAYLFSNIAQTFGKKAIGIILTGMGSDGSKELKLMLDKGAVTIAQSKESALIHGMPGVAIQHGSAKYVLNAEEIGQLLADIEKNYRKS
ncbi:MAG: chemotaxis-specific protein-glutamate methyltransferase CheB [Bacteroidales bacterium]